MYFRFIPAVARLAAFVAVTAIAATPSSATANTCGSGPVQAQVMIVLDRSTSMSESSGAGTKWSVSRQAVNNLVGYFQGRLELGIMLYPAFPDSQGFGSCDAGRVNVPPAFNTANAINGLLASSYPKGLTPSTATLDEARRYLMQTRVPGKTQYVIFITDGKETCASKAPRTATAALLAAGIKTFVVGFGSGVSASALTDAARDGGTNQYYQADNPNALMQTLSNIGSQISCCGNGQLDAGERCDTAIPFGAPGGCPTLPAHCNDSNPQTADLVIGGGCQAVCSHNNTGPSTPTPPTGTCGNGKLDAGEACDISIPAGHLGACPLSCNDNNSCTHDAMTGNACQTRCAHQPISAPIGGDGCCAPGATNATDSDCPVSNTCGNQQLDVGETCDPSIPQGAAGACPASCDDGDQCTIDGLGGSGCNVKCVYSPKPPSAVKDGCCAPGLTQKEDPDCLPACGPDRQSNCVDPCHAIQCGAREYCTKGICLPWPANGGSEQGGAPSFGGANGTDKISGAGCNAASADPSGAGVALLLLLGAALVARRRRD